MVVWDRLERDIDIELTVSSAGVTERFVTCAALQSSANCPLWLSLCFGCGIVAWDRPGRDIDI